MQIINIHSLTDLITNSSTVIYTYSDNSVKALEGLVNEFFKMLGVNKKCKDVFTMEVRVDYDELIDYIEYCEEEYIPEEFLEYAALRKLVEDISSGKTQKPAWFKKVEKSYKDCDAGYYKPSTTLYVMAKEPEYEKLAKLVTEFLYSTKHEAGRDG
jgi:hypothetical protein